MRRGRVLRLEMEASPAPALVRPAIEARLRGAPWPPGPEAAVARAVADAVANALADPPADPLADSLAGAPAGAPTGDHRETWP